jgi:hypothetical protein
MVIDASGECGTREAYPAQPGEWRTIHESRFTRPATASIVVRFTPRRMNPGAMALVT